MDTSHNPELFNEARPLGEIIYEKHGWRPPAVQKFCESPEGLAVFEAFYPQVFAAARSVEAAWAAVKKVHADTAIIDRQRDNIMFQRVAEADALCLRTIAEDRAATEAAYVERYNADQIERSEWYTTQTTWMEGEIVNQVAMQTAVYEVRIAALEKEVADKDKLLAQARRDYDILVGLLRKGGNSIHLIERHLAQFERTTDNFRDGINDVNKKLDWLVHEGHDAIITGQRESDDHVVALRTGIIAVGEEQQNRSTEIIDLLRARPLSVTPPEESHEERVARVHALTTETISAEDTAQVDEILDASNSVQAEEEGEEEIAEVEGDITIVEVEESEEVVAEQLPSEPSTALALIDGEESRPAADLFESIDDKVSPANAQFMADLEVLRRGGTPAAEVAKEPTASTSGTMNPVFNKPANEFRIPRFLTEGRVPAELDAAAAE